MAILELVVMPKTNSRNGWKWQNYSVKIIKSPEEKEITLTLKNGESESVSEDFEIKTVTEKDGAVFLKTAYTVVSDQFYDFLEKHFGKEKSETT